MKRSDASAERMKIGGVIVSRDIGMVSVQGTPHAAGIAGTILEAIGSIGINAEFISCSPDLGGGDTISICVERARLDDAIDRIEEVRDAVQAQRVVTKEDLCSVAVFGPHFREIPNVASRVFKALAEVGINIIGISTSVSSVTCVFAESKLPDALTSLRSHFEIP